MTISPEILRFQKFKSSNRQQFLHANAETARKNFPSAQSPTQKFYAISNIQNFTSLHF